MMPYRGLHSAKQYNKGEPVKFGYKQWVFAVVMGINITSKYIVAKMKEEQIV